MNRYLCKRDPLLHRNINFIRSISDLQQWLEHTNSSRKEVLQLLDTAVLLSQCSDVQDVELLSWKWQFVPSSAQRCLKPKWHTSWCPIKQWQFKKQPWRKDPGWQQNSREVDRSESWMQSVFQQCFLHTHIQESCAGQLLGRLSPMLMRFRVCHLDCLASGKLAWCLM